MVNLNRFEELYKDYAEMKRMSNLVVLEKLGVQEDRGLIGFGFWDASELITRNLSN